MEPDKNKILIVDDDKPLRRGLAMILKSIGYEPLEAENGKEALKQVEEHHPALIILDVMMKGISGLEVCRILKTDTDTNAIKIIILSARGQIIEKEEGLKAGADEYVTKPFDYKELIKKIKQLMDS